MAQMLSAKEFTKAEDTKRSCSKAAVASQMVHGKEFACSA